MKTKKTGKKGKEKLIWVAAVLFFLLGAGVFLYPFISNFLAEKNHEKVIDSYKAKVEKISSEDLEKEWEEAKIYNENLAGDPVHDPFIVGSGYAVPDNYNEVLNVDSSGVMCYLEIPKINLNLPVYHGTSEEVLQRGAGHLEMTALPIGGENRRSVLTGHRGLPSAELFTRLDEMEVGDYFFIHVLDQTLAYQVNEIKTVKPEELQKLNVNPKGEDPVTLVTCTPYGVNTHRLLVTGERTDYVPEIKEQEEKVPLTTRLMPWRYYIAGGAAALGIIAAVMITMKILRYRKYGKKRKKKR